jgi:hypothetical protein
MVRHSSDGQALDCRSSLLGMVYQFNPDMSVNRTECPRDVYPVLQEWRRSQ